jgi:hypothetical protein
MLNSCKKGYFLSGNALKIIAAASMLIDHIGFMLFPRLTVLRIIGRLSFPIFAFMIAEGAAYTKNKLRYFLGIFILGTGCQIVLSLFDSGAKLGALISFSIGIIGVFSLQYMKKVIFSEKFNPTKKLSAVLIFVFTVFGIYLLNEKVRIDYGFFGCIAPLSASLFKADANCQNSFFKKLDNNFLNLLCFGICTAFMNAYYGGIQHYAIFALIPLAFYSGKRGKLKMKYFFYIFYPLHIALLEGIRILFF